MYDPYYDPFFQNVEIIKNYFKRKAVLILAILGAVNLLAVVVTGFLSMSALTPLINAVTDQALSDAGLSQASGYTELSTTTSSFSGVINQLPFILTVVSFALIYFKSKSDKPGSSPLAGVTILYVVTIIELVSSIIAAVFLALILAAGALTLSLSSGIDSSTFISAIPAVVILAAVIFILLFSAISHLKYIGSVRKSMTSIELSAKGAKAYGVITLILASFMILTVALLPLSYVALSSLKPSELYGVDAATLRNIIIYSGAAAVLSAAYYIADAVVALGYAKYIRKVTTGYYSPEGAPAPVYRDLSSPASFIPPETIADINAPAAEIPRNVCPVCRNQVDNDAVFCPRCGQKLK